jgi:hypothetical protein
MRALVGKEELPLNILVDCVGADDMYRVSGLFMDNTRKETHISCTQPFVFTYY